MCRTTIRSWILGALLALSGLPALAQKAPAEDPKTRIAKAEAMFQERCKKAGEFIHKTAKNVEGILLLKIREQTSRGDQYRMDDPYGHDSWGDEYIKSFLYGRNVKGTLTIDGRGVSKGYSYVDALDPKDGKRYRYTGRIEEPWQRDKSYLKGYTRFVLNKILAPDSAPRYGVTYDDISTKEERDYWIAGSSLKVLDLKTNEVMAERIGYMMDRGQGNNSGGRAAWLLAADYACPEFPPDGSGHKYQGEQTRRFVEKILRPSLER